MTARRASLTLRVEREVPGPSGERERISLSSRLEAPADGSVEPSEEELRGELANLRRQLDGLSTAGVGPNRTLGELIETYRPRQRELVDLLEAEGEISAPEANLLLAHLAEGDAGPKRPAAPDLPGPTERPIAALPLEHDRSPTVPRPVPQLLAEYRIESLKQAGAVRARRQISFEEYMALKRHFSVAVPADPSGGSASQSHPAHGR